MVHNKDLTMGYKVCPPPPPYPTGNVQEDFSLQGLQSFIMGNGVSGGHTLSKPYDQIFVMNHPFL